MIISRSDWPQDWSAVPAWTECSEEVYEHFLNVLDPIEWCGGYFQCCEPYTHELHASGRWKAKYLTFTKQDGKCWFLGIQFRGDYPAKEVS